MLVLGEIQIKRFAAGLEGVPAALVWIGLSGFAA